MIKIAPTFEFNQRLIAQIPGVFGIMDLNSQFQAISDEGARWIGFKSNECLAGLSYPDVHCQAAEDANLFLGHDEIVKNRERIRFLGRYGYADNTWKIILGQKYLLRDADNKPSGIVSQFDDFTHVNLFDASRFLFDSAAYYHGNPKKHFFYFIEDQYPKSSLSERQSECLFYLLRSKKPKDIAKILQISNRTVEEYINQVKDKLDCRTTAQLIEKAVAQGYVPIIIKKIMDE